jgi:hypothetical protein
VCRCLLVPSRDGQHRDYLYARGLYRVHPTHGRVITNNKSGPLLCSALLLCWCYCCCCALCHSLDHSLSCVAAAAAVLLCLFGGKECGKGGEPWERTGGQAQAFGGGPVCQSGTGMGETRGPKRQDQGTRTAGGNWICHRNNLGEIGSGSGIGIWKGGEKKGPRPLEQGAEVRVASLSQVLRC